MPDLKKTQHYTTNYNLICKNLTQDIPEGSVLVEPFVGKGDLLCVFPNHKWETYDIDLSNPADYHKDTLLEKIDYTGKWIITNPPYLAKNKANDKKYFIDNPYDDLYKIALHSFIGCEGGLVIVPLNFITDEDSEQIRRDFLSQYRILNMNIFTYPVFETTSYSVCSFTFIKEENTTQDFTIWINGEEKFQCNIQKQYGYRMAGQEFYEIEKFKSCYNRLTATNKLNITNMKLYALDTRTERLHIEYDEEHYMGKPTDRVFLTFTTNKVLTKEQQVEILTQFNKEVDELRKKYHNLIFTNYRDWNRKRIGFTFAYKLLSKITYELGY